MKYLLKAVLACGLMAGLQQAAQAQIIFSSSATTSAWIGTPTYNSVSSANLTGLSAQGDPGITGANGVLAEMFTPTSAFSLGSFNLIMGVASNATYGVDIIDLGPAGTVSPSLASATYTPSSTIFSGSVALSAAGEEQGIFTLGSAVSLAANEEYALEILTPSAQGQNAFIWYRNSVVDPGGQMFSAGDSAGARNTLAGNGQAGGAPRTGTLALYSVPEPSCMALFGLGATAFALRRRKN